MLCRPLRFALVKVMDGAESNQVLPLANWINASLTGFLSNFDIAASPLRELKTFERAKTGLSRFAALYITRFALKVK
jgi:hypothetical protein